MLRAFLRHRLVVALNLLAACALFLYAGTSVFLQARLVRSVARESVPLLQRIPRAEKRRAALQAQLEIADVEQAVRGGSHDEMVRSFVLPGKPEWDRLLAALELAGDWLRLHGRMTALSPIEMGPVERREDGLTVQPLGMEATVTPDGARTWTAFLSLMGPVSIADVLAPQRRAELLHATERESPASLTAVEAFLATDLLRYAREPRPAEEHLRRSFAAEETVRMIDALLQDASLAAARDMLGGELGRELERQGPWPMRFLSVDAAAMEHLPYGNVRLTMRLLAWGR